MTEATQVLVLVLILGAVAIFVGLVFAREEIKKTKEESGWAKAILAISLPVACFLAFLIPILGIVLDTFLG